MFHVLQFKSQNAQSCWPDVAMQKPTSLHLKCKMEVSEKHTALFSEPLITDSYGAGQVIDATVDRVSVKLPLEVRLQEHINTW